MVVLAGLWLHTRLEEAGVASAAMSLRGRTIAVDAGHGGIDPGAIGVDGSAEDPLVLAVSLRLARMLESAGATVLLTRGADEPTTGTTTQGPSHRTKLNLRRRVELINAASADVVVSVHANSFSNPSEHGAQTFYTARFASSRDLADLVQRQLARLTGETRRKISDHIDHYVLNHTDMPGVTVEIGFLSNPREARLLGDPAYQQRVAYAIYAGLAQWFARLPATATEPSSPRPRTALSR